MKRFLFILTLAIITVVVFSSCRKCRNCTAYYYSDGTVASTQEYCGLKATVDTEADDFLYVWDEYDSPYDNYDTWATCD